MKKYFMIFVAAVAVFAACQEEMAPEIVTDENIVADYPVKMTFTAASEQTKTILNDTEILWESDDRIKVLWETGSNGATAVPSDEGASATFTTNVEEADAYYAVHPYAAESSYSDGKIVVKVPAEQGGAFENANIAVAKADAQNEFVFKHLVGMIAFSTDTPGEVTISGAEGDVLTGTVTITGFEEESGDPIYEEDKVTDASNTIKLTVTASGTYYAAFLPSAKLTYLSIKVGDGEAAEYALSANQLQMARGKVWDLGNISPRLGKSFFVTPTGTKTGDGKTWETAMSYDQMATLMAWNRHAIENGNGNGKNVSDAGPAAGSEDYTAHNTVHAAQMDGATFYMAAGTYKPSAYTRMSWPGLDKDVNIRILGGYMISQGTDLTKKAGETIIDTKDIAASTQRAFYIKDNIDIEFSDITFTGGVGDGTHGGGAFFILPADKAQCSTVTLNNCTFCDNNSNSRGAIYLNGAGTLNLRNCNFENNKAKSVGGAVAMLGGTLNAEGCRFIGNTLEMSGEKDCFGGALYCDNNTIATIDDCVFTDNVAKNTATNIAEDTETATAAKEFRACGGAVCILDDSELTLKNCKFTDNYTQDTEEDTVGGTIYVESKLTLSGCEFSLSSYAGEQAKMGGAVALSGAEATINQGTDFSGCSAGCQGGAVYVEAGSKVTIAGCSFAGNKVADDDGKDNSGGAIYGTSNANNVLTITSSEFTGNTAGAFGGAISYYGKNLTIDDGCVFENNRTVYRNGIAYGGAIYVKGLGARISNSTFVDNAASNSGSGGFGGDIQVHTDASATVTSCTFSRTGAEATATSGGALGASQAELTLKDVTITGCNASNHGGAIYAQNNAVVTIQSGSDIGRCSAKNGGAIYLTTSSLTIEESEISDCSTSDAGACLYLAGICTVDIQGSKFTSNKTSAGSGGFVCTTTGSDKHIMTIEDSEIDDCDSQSSGGGIYFGGAGSSLSISKSSLKNCNGTGTGGAIYLTSASSMTLENVVFESNFAGDRGGALCQGGSASICYANQCDFINNSAANYGGAIAGSKNSDCAYFLNNCVFTGNHLTVGTAGGASGTAIYMKESHLCMNNCSLYGNTTAVGGDYDINLSKGDEGSLSGSGVVIMNSTFLHNGTKSSSRNLNQNFIDDYPATLILMNNIMMCDDKSVNSNTKVTSAGYNYVSSGLTATTTDTVLETTDFNVFSQDETNGWYYWSGAADLSAKTSYDSLRSMLSGQATLSGTPRADFGSQFLSWLEGLTVRGGKNALLYDIAGNPRSTGNDAAWWPGCYQGN